MGDLLDIIFYLFLFGFIASIGIGYISIVFRLTNVCKITGTGNIAEKIAGIIGLVMRVVVFIPLLYSAYYGTTTNYASGIFGFIYNVGYGMITKGIKTFFISIPVEIVLAIIFMLVSFISDKMEASKCKKESLEYEANIKKNAEIIRQNSMEKLREIKKKEKEQFEKVRNREKEIIAKKAIVTKENKEKIEKYLNSFNKINPEELTKPLSEHILNFKSNIRNNLLNIKPKTINLSNNEQYNFLENQFLEITKNLKEVVLKSNIINDYNIKEIVESDEININDIVNPTLYLLKKKEYSQKQISKIFQTENFKDLVISFKQICNNNNIEINFDDDFLYEKKLSEYKKDLFEMMEILRKEYGIVRKGHEGEKKVSEHLELYNDILINLENILFKVEKTTVEADNIIICDNGVFCIETKNYGNVGETIVITKDGRWKRFKGREELDIDNISEQHNRHIGIMQRTVNQELKNMGIDIPYVYFEPIYVIANDKVEIKNESDEIKLLRASSIYPYIQKFQAKTTLSKEIQETIKSIILKHKQDLIKYPVHDIKEAYTNKFNNLISEIENKKLQIILFNEYINIINSTYGFSIMDVDNKKYISIGKI